MIAMSLKSSRNRSRKAKVDDGRVT